MRPSSLNEDGGPVSRPLALVSYANLRRIDLSQERRRPRDDEFRMPSLRLEGQAALMTGGSRGLGLGIALALAHAAADLVLAARSRDELEKAAELVRRTGRRAEVVEADVSDAASCAAAVKE